jgi:hypothetical protein
MEADKFAERLNEHIRAFASPSYRGLKATVTVRRIESGMV